MTSSLTVKRVSVHRRSHVLYDEQFHNGVNIIHGDNGSGKSTIMDFIFFGLGGDLREFRDEAALADYVIIEIQGVDGNLSLKRDVSPSGNRPMQIFFGGYEEAIAANIQQWHSFPYKRTDRNFSFSQVMFKAIGIPEAISDGASNITMHQILRVLYSDQLTPIQRIFRVEPFDTWQTRQAVGDLLCGLGGYDLYELQLKLRDLGRKFDEASSRLKSLMAVAASYGENILIEHIENAIKKEISERDSINAQLSEILQRPEDTKSSREVSLLVKRQRRELTAARTDLAKITEEIETLEFEIEDSQQFLVHLTSALSDFDDAAASFFALGNVRFEYCPACFSSVANKSRLHHLECHLCGTANTEHADDSRALAVRLDLEMQIRESAQLQEERKARLRQIKSQERAANSKFKSALAAVEMGGSGIASEFEVLIADLSRKIGYIDNEIRQLQQREELARDITRLSTEKANINAEINQTKDAIDGALNVQTRRKFRAYTAISETTKNLLSFDLDEHSDFGVVDRITFDYSGDWIAINDNKNRVGSASGMVVLKNSFLLGMFISAINDSEFNLPRFMLFDNVEDKGMVQERSWNFQRLIVAASKNSRSQHQIIFSTSKIAPELEGTDRVVGGKYTKQRRTLRINY